MLCKALVVKITAPRLEVPGFISRNVLRLGKGMVLEPLIECADNVEAGINVCAAKAAWVAVKAV